MLLVDVYESTISEEFIKRGKYESHTVDINGEMSELPGCYSEWRNSIKYKVLKSSPTEHLKQNQRYSNHLKM